MIEDVCVQSLGTWDHVRTKTQLPPGLRLLMGDVNCGSNTPSMVQSVLKWRREEKEASQLLWEQLDGRNDKVNRWISLLQEQHAFDQESYEATLLFCAGLTALQWKEEAQDLLGSAKNLKNLNVRVMNPLVCLREWFEKVRLLMRKMGDGANVPIEPSEQTRLLDRTIETAGVIFAGVPGAGGYDAIFAVVIDPSSFSSLRHAPEISPFSAVEAVWSSFQELSVLTQTLNEDSHGILVEDTFSLSISEP